MIRMNKFIKKNKQLSIFITAGFPNLDSTTKEILSLQKKGVDFLEVGIPFSDPMADGPIIQKSSEIALKNGMNLDILFNQLASIKDEVKIPLVLMGYFNPILKYDIRKFLQRCKEIGVRSTIIPDLSLEIYERFYKEMFDEFSVSMIFLVTPDTELKRVEQIVEISKDSFVYLVSSSKITGQGFVVNEETQLKYKKIKEACKGVPLMLGFGISSKKDIIQAHQFCDGAIIGSAYIKSIMEEKEFDVF